MVKLRPYRRGGWEVDLILRLSSGETYRERRKAPVASKSAAQRWGEERERHVLIHGGPKERKEVPTFEAFVTQRWLPTYPGSAGNRPTTVREKEQHVRVHLVPAFGALALDKVRGEVVDRFFAKLAADGLREKTRWNIRATLRRILASAVEWGYLETIPPLPRWRCPDPTWDFLTADESDRLFAAARTAEERALFVFAVHTGARAGEQIAVEWLDLDWASRTVVFRRSSTRGDVGPTKGKRERRVPFTATLEKSLREIRHLRGPLVFCNPDGSALTLDQLHERLWGALRRAGLRRIRWHETRHSFGSQLAIAGVPIRQIQEWMGHATISMTMRYAHLAPSGGAELIHALDRPGRGDVVETGGRAKRNSA